MADVKKTIKLVLAGLVAGLLSYLGIRYFSREYRSAKKELRNLDRQLDSIESELELSEELESISIEQVESVRDCLRRERQTVKSIRDELADNQEVIRDSERRIAESEAILEQCREIFSCPSDF